MASTFILSSFLTLALAQTTTLTIPAIGYDQVSFLASVVTANSAATTLSLACPKGEECGLFPNHTIVYGPSTYNMDMSDPYSDFTATQDCVIAPSSAVCKETAGGSEANFPGSSTETYEATDIASMILTVTKGAEKLTASAAATPVPSSMASATSGSGASRSTASVAQSTSSNSASQSASASGTNPSVAVASTGAAAANAFALGGGAFGVAAGVLGLFL